MKQVDALTTIGQGSGKQTVILPSSVTDALGDAFKMMRGATRS